MGSLKRTPLYDFNLEHGARMVDFAGWEMPVQYQSILDEHRAVRTAAGVFDVSHMGEFEVSGAQAMECLNHLVTNDVSRLVPGRVLYTPMCRPDGGVVDDLLIYCRTPSAFLLCVNASNTEKDLNWINQHSEGFECRVEDRSSELGLLALQGPRADAILAGLTGIPLDPIRYYGFAEGDVAGVPCLVSRTGYTGERGFELYCPSDQADGLARALFEAGQSEGLVLAGLGARDSLRLEAGFSLYGHEISDSISPIEAGLQWTVKFAKPAFIGREVLSEQKEKGVRRQIAFFKTGDRRIVRPGTAVLSGDLPVGEVVSGTLSPMLNEAIGSMIVESGSLSGDLAVDLRGRRHGLELTQPPFVKLNR